MPAGPAKHMKKYAKSTLFIGTLAEHWTRDSRTRGELNSSVLLVAATFLHPMGTVKIRWEMHKCTRAHSPVCLHEPKSLGTRRDLKMYWNVEPRQSARWF